MAVQRYSLHWMSWGPHLLQLDVLGASSPSAGCPGGLISFSWMSWGPQISFNWMSWGPQISFNWMSWGPQISFSWISWGPHLLQLDVLGASSPSAGYPGEAGLCDVLLWLCRAHHTLP
ncbi:uncharacterized protein LOC118377581 isoform X5 [Oncorhynchus keta]|uniref:uncharacterized protein LOC118377581 isoform X5 n=1 Tax=Oncorhynchus keta TaxID=8018 RepID=UPI00227D6568|nr:uncharacterized protein LOC118377581 isoform X5 [Oncorhynchus keta]